MRSIRKFLVIAVAFAMMGMNILPVLAKSYDQAVEEMAVKLTEGDSVKLTILGIKGEKLGEILVKVDEKGGIPVPFLHKVDVEYLRVKFDAKGKINVVVKLNTDDKAILDQITLGIINWKLDQEETKGTGYATFDQWRHILGIGDVSDIDLVVPMPEEPKDEEVPAEPGEDNQVPAEPGEDNQEPEEPGEDNQEPEEPGEDNQEPAEPGEDNQEPAEPGEDVTEEPEVPGDQDTEEPTEPGDQDTEEPSPEEPGDQEPSPEEPGDQKPSPEEPAEPGDQEPEEPSPEEPAEPGDQEPEEPEVPGSEDEHPEEPTEPGDEGSPEEPTEPGQDETEEPVAPGGDEDHEEPEEPVAPGTEEPEEPTPGTEEPEEPTPGTEEPGVPGDQEEEPQPEPGVPGDQEEEPQPPSEDTEEPAPIEKPVEEMTIREKFNNGKLFSKEAFRAEMLRLINEERARVGVGPLEMAEYMRAGTELRARELAEYGHIRIDGVPHARPRNKEESFDTAFEETLKRAPALKGKGVGENSLAHFEVVYVDIDALTEVPDNLKEKEGSIFHMTAEELARKHYEMWKGSPGHYKNMINKHYKTMWVDAAIGKSQEDDEVVVIVGNQNFDYIGNDELPESCVVHSRTDIWCPENPKGMPLIFWKDAPPIFEIGPDGRPIFPPEEDEDGPKDTEDEGVVGVVGEVEEPEEPKEPEHDGEGGTGHGSEDGTEVPAVEENETHDS